MKKLLGIVVLGLLLNGNAFAKEQRIVCYKLIKASDDRIFSMMEGIEIGFYIDHNNKNVRMPNPNNEIILSDIYNIKFNKTKKQVSWQLVTQNSVTNEKLVNVHFYKTDKKQFATRVYNFKNKITEKDLKIWYTFQCINN